jgi:hypothetical protein
MGKVRSLRYSNGCHMLTRRRRSSTLEHSEDWGGRSSPEPSREANQVRLSGGGTAGTWNGPYEDRHWSTDDRFPECWIESWGSWVSEFVFASAAHSELPAVAAINPTWLLAPPSTASSHTAFRSDDGQRWPEYNTIMDTVSSEEASRHLRVNSISMNDPHSFPSNYMDHAPPTRPGNQAVAFPDR